MAAQTVIDVQRFRIDTPMPLRLTPGGPTHFVVEGNFDDGFWSVSVKFAAQPGQSETVAFCTFDGPGTTAEAIVVTNQWLATQAAPVFHILEGEMTDTTSVPMVRPGDEARFTAVVTFRQVPEPDEVSDAGNQPAT